MTHANELNERGLTVGEIQNDANILLCLNHVEQPYDIRVFHSLSVVHNTLASP